ncbi:MAG: hypothetical protein SF053_08815 [Bacteroidia bacterium]|nr:hypothetical protein [Bacteroidia bacterium]
MKYWLVISVGLVIGTYHAHAQSGWVREPGHYFVKADISVFASDQYYNPQGVRQVTSSFRQQALNVYAEYGLAPRLAVHLAAPLVRLNSFETTAPAIGQGDLRLELKYALLKGPVPISLTVSPELPTGRANAAAANRNIPGDVINLPTGDGEFNLVSTLAVSSSLGPWYGTLWGAYNLRTAYRGEIFKDLWLMGAEVGVAPKPGLWLNVKLRNQHATGLPVSQSLGFVRGDATAFSQLGFGLYQKISANGGFTADVSAILPGPVGRVNIYAGPTLSVGWVWEK